MVQFEDDSQFLVLWKDISPGEKPENGSKGKQTWHGGQKGAGDRPSDTLFFTAALLGRNSSAVYVA